MASALATGLYKEGGETFAATLFMPISTPADIVGDLPAHRLQRLVTPNSLVPRHRGKPYRDVRFLVK
jgi:hypothetical protein